MPTKKVLKRIEYVVHPANCFAPDTFDNMHDAITYAQECGQGSKVFVHTEVREYYDKKKLYNIYLSTPYIIQVVWSDTESWLADKIFR